MKSLIITLLVTLISFNGFSQNENFEKLDQFLSVLEENDRFFGSIAVSQDGEVIYSNAIGSADIENNIANNNETKFRVGSISKIFTTTLIMKAVELGKVNLDDSIEPYFSDLTNADQITVRHLLNHRSGITNFTDRSFFSWYTESITQSALLDTIVSKEVDFEPNTDYSYSNSNYVLLTFILEKAFEQSYDQILNTYIIDPLQLSNTQYGDIINTANNEAKSYTLNTDWVIEPEGDMSIPLGAGGIVSTPSDLCRFIQALTDGKLITTQSFEQMKPIGEEEYGFALYETEFDEHTALGHGGNIDAFASNLVHFEDEDICVAVTCNGSNYGLHDVVVAAVSEIFGQPYDVPSFDFIKLSSEELDQYLGVYESDEIPVDMTIAKAGDTLMLMIEGQAPGVFVAEGNHKFSIMQHGVKVEFTPEEKKMLFEQHGMALEFTIKEGSPTVEQVETDVKVTGDMDDYVGVYASDLLPMDLTISKDGDKLIGQGDGQPSFDLEPIGDHEYSNPEIGLTITFLPEEKKMSFVQGGAEFEMTMKE